MSIEARVRKVIAEQLKVKEQNVSESAAFIDDLGADSVDVMELIMAFEEEFDVNIPDEDAEEITTVSSAIRYITEKMSAPIQDIGTDGDAKTTREATR